MSGDPHYYSAYGLAIRSEVALPELRAVSTDRSPDVVVRAADAKTFRSSLDADADVTSLEFDSFGTLIVVDGQEIVFDLVSPDLRQSKIFRRSVENQALALVLIQRGLLVLHASAVVVGGRAVVFVGPRTVGKSTTAAAFHLQGYPVIADDLVGVRIDDDVPMVVPGVPQLRLDPDVVAALGIDGAVRPDDDYGPEKWYRRVEPVLDPLPLACCYVLKESESLSIEQISGAERFFRIVEHAYTDGVLSGAGMTPNGFNQCSAIVEDVPVRRLCRPKHHDILPSLVTTVAEDVTTSESSQVSPPPSDSSR